MVTLRPRLSAIVSMRRSSASDASRVQPDVGVHRRAVGAVAQAAQVPRHHPQGAVTGHEPRDQDDRVEGPLRSPRRVGDVAAVQSVVSAAPDEAGRLADGAALPGDRAQARGPGEPGRAEERAQRRLHDLTVAT